ncbi:hypothetical protein JD969_00295 [Planctomycetota bacterium]|nr:hypothetical protein JD969_00295 [Planctomycetota bacterium]
MSPFVSSTFSEELANCAVIEQTHWRPEMRLGEVELKSGEVMQCVFVKESDIRQAYDGFNLPWVPLAAGHIVKIRPTRFAVPETVQMRMNVLHERSWSGDVSLGVKMCDGKVVDLKGKSKDMWCFTKLPQGYDWGMVDELVEEGQGEYECDSFPVAVCLI